MDEGIVGNGCGEKSLEGPQSIQLIYGNGLSRNQIPLIPIIILNAVDQPRLKKKNMAKSLCTLPRSPWPRVTTNILASMWDSVALTLAIIAVI